MKSTTDLKLLEFAQRIDRLAETAAVLKSSLGANYLRAARSVSQTIASNPALLEPALMAALAKAVGVDEIHVTDGKGVFRWGNVAGFYGFDFSTSDQTKSFLRILEDPSFELAQDPTPRRADKVLFQYISVARRDRPGTVQIGVAPKELEELLRQASVQTLIEGVSVGRSGYYFALGQDGKVAAHSSAGQVGLDLSSEGFAKEMLAKKSGTVEHRFKDAGVYASYGSNNGQVLAAAVPVSEFRGRLTTLLAGLGISAAAFIALSGLLSLLIARSIVRPVEAVVRAMGKLSAGDLILDGRGREEDESIRARRDELGALGQSKGDLRGTLQKVVGDIRSSSDLVSQGSERLSGTAQVIAQGASEQAASIEELSSSVEELASTVRQNADNTSQADALSRRVASSAEDSGRAVEQMVSSMSEIA